MPFEKDHKTVADLQSGIDADYDDPASHYQAPEFKPKGTVDKVVEKIAGGAMATLPQPESTDSDELKVMQNQVVRAKASMKEPIIGKRDWPERALKRAKRLHPKEMRGVKLYDED